MTEEIRKKAEALIAYIDDMNFIHRKESIAGEFELKNMSLYKKLKASLRPSREEVIDGLDDVLVAWFGDGTKERVALENAIEELSK
jgi:hypothetical protein